MARGAGSAFAGDARVKDMINACAAEEFEIACYMALRIGAERFGIADVVETCDLILKDENRMAEWLKANLPQIVNCCLEDKPMQAVMIDAEDADVPEAFGPREDDLQTASSNAQRSDEADEQDLPIESALPPRFTDIHEGREIIEPLSSPTPDAAAAEEIRMSDRSRPKRQLQTQ